MTEFAIPPREAETIDTVELTTHLPLMTRTKNRTPEVGQRSPSPY